MEKNILITDKSHKRIFDTYKELKKKLPTKLFRMKVFSTPKFNFDKKPILKKIENDEINSIKLREKPIGMSKYSQGSQKIYILSNKTISLKQKHLKTLYSDDYKNGKILRNTLLKEKSKFIKNNIEQNGDYDNNIESLGNQEFLGYNFRSHTINDSNMKTNIYLPKIIDRMKYILPRNERERNGLLVEGVGIFSNHVIRDDYINDKYEININDIINN